MNLIDNKAKQSAKRILKGINQILHVDRFGFAAYVIPIVASIIIYKLFVVQVVRYEYYLSLSRKEILKTITIKGERGKIFDRNKVLLAGNIAAFSVFVHPDEIENEDSVRSLLHDLLKTDDAKAGIVINRKRKFQWIRRNLDTTLLPFWRTEWSPYRRNAVGIVRTSKRLYPHQERAASVLGFAGVDNQGLTGIEKQYDEQLKGRFTEKRVIKDPRGNLLVPKGFVDSIRNTLKGKDVMLTISSAMQKTIDEIVRKYTVTKSMSKCLAIVMEARSGEILSMTTYPNYDPNKYLMYEKDVYDRNPAIQDLIQSDEILSTVLMTAVADKTGLDPVLCEKAESLLKKSAYHKISALMDATEMDDYMRLFGFGRLTGIDFPMEEPGKYDAERILMDENKLMCTPLQILAWYNSLWNGGLWVQPHLRLALDQKGASKTNRIGIKADVAKFIVEKMTGKSNAPDVRKRAAGADHRVCVPFRFTYLNRTKKGYGAMEIIRKSENREMVALIMIEGGMNNTMKKVLTSMESDINAEIVPGL
jgi:stage V sporulation protein D (sporulation-specific penicillin-binding protein)